MEKRLRRILFRVLVFRLPSSCLLRSATLAAVLTSEVCQCEEASYHPLTFLGTATPVSYAAPAFVFFAGLNYGTGYTL